jgi:hypothetical protein
MKYGWGALAVALVVATGAAAQGVGFLTENQRLASYCAGVSETRMRLLGEFIKKQCTGSTRKECGDAQDDLAKQQLMDRRLWTYLTQQIFTSTEQGPKEKNLSQRWMAKGSDDWMACEQRPSDKQVDELLICRESHGCLLDARFRFLPP